MDNGLECPKGTVKQPSGDRAFSDEVAEPGISEEDATRLQIGFTRGKVYFPVRNEDGSISGFVGYADGQLKMPPHWIGTNVVKLKRA